MKKVLFSLVALIVCVGLVGSAFAYFTDTETSTGNTFTAGTLDLQMSNGTGYQDVFTGTIATAANMAPGEEVGPFDVYFKNNGTMSGYLKVKISYANYDDPAAYGEFVSSPVSGTAYAKMLIVSKAYADGGAENKAPYWAAQCIANSDVPTALANGEIVAAPGASPVEYLPTIYGMSTIETYYADAGGEIVWAPGESHYEYLYLTLSSDADSSYAFDGVTVTFTATLSQEQ